jgi:serine/threonine protein kinase/Tol biopolymer transport system component
MTLSAGARLGPYEIVSLMGVGGMGEVYRARDTRLDRTVAVKVLVKDFVDRTDRRRRFETEARAISSLHHPHICTLFDVGEQDGLAFLVMEYLEGETLDDRLTRGPLPVKEMLTSALQIADALDHAHREHFVHRDLKPGNVILTSSGAKLLDFGLVRRTAGEPVEPVSSSTLSLDQRKLTAEGALLGTLQYMAPEQLEGKEADARTDIFALGTLMFEMATGEKAFEGASQATLIASILTHQPPVVSSVRRNDDLPPAIDHVIERCLAKHPIDRWQTARDVKLELEWIADGRPQTMRSMLRPRWLERESIAWAVAALAIVVAGIAATRQNVSEPQVVQVTRFVVEPPAGTLIDASENTTRIALSPDGRQLAFVATTHGRQQLWIRSLGSLAAQPLAGTDGAVSPFWSPDSRFVGFYSSGTGELKKVEVSGGPARTICAARMEGVATWGRDGTVLFTQFLDGIYRVSGEGGTPARVTTVDKARRELNHYWPSFLPDGRRFVYMVTALDATGLRATPSVYVASLDSTDVTLLAQTHSKMVYAPPGRLLFVEQGALLAQNFDTTALKLSGEPVKIADGIGYLRTIGNAAFSISETGVLAYQGAADDSQLVWYDRRGNVTDTGWAKQNYGTVRISPDARKIAVDVADPNTGSSDIWIYDLSQGAPVRFTLDLDDESDPVWSPDSRRIMFRMNRGGPASLKLGSAAPNLYAKTLGVVAEEELLVANPGPLNPEDWSLDNKWIAYVNNTRQTGMDLWMRPLAGDGKPQSFAPTRFNEWGARFSPDSARVAFVSNESGTSEVYVTTVQGSGEKTRVSTSGGTSPRWRGDGRELFYVSTDNRSIMAVSIERSPILRAGAPVRLFTMSADLARRISLRGTAYDVTPDGERFLVRVPVGEAESSRITVVQNWTAGLN